ncbi:hypothetical protein F4780DRAFT_794824 [Xylariomycetidae sp. FL0641]|nr:hypothetical protein F4780DRAFT_794824 [Xylariomycetidae sp. FL0641]
MPPAHDLDCRGSGPYVLNDKIFGCMACNRAFSSFEALQQHVQGAKAHESTRRLCEGCGLWWATNAAFQRHLKDPDFHPTCPLCKKIFTTQTFIPHLSSTAPTKCPFPSCGKSFPHDQLSEHFIYGHHCCNKCNVAFKSLQELSDHRASSTAHSWCEVCGVDLKTPCDLTTHCREEHFSCDKCEETFFTEKEHVDHLRGSSQHFYCGKCNKDHAGGDELRSHYTDRETWSTGVQHNYCATCDVDFDNTHLLRAHFWNSAAHHFCYKCKEHFRSGAALHDHFSKRIRDPDSDHWYCIQCEVAFRSEKELEAHILQNPLQHYYCQKCRRLFSTAAALSEHKVDSPKHFYCQACKLECPSKEAIKQHFRHMHPYCSECDQHFVYESEFIAHRKDRHYCCADCDLELDDQGALNNHLEEFHFHCLKCDRQFSTHFLLDAHRAVDPAKHHYCKSCQFGFPSDAEFHSHRKEKHYYCEECEQSFETHEDIASHSLHKDHQNYCTHCGRQFGGQWVLEWHQARDHEFCSDCTEVIRNPEQLEIHNREKHAKYACGLCNRKFGTKQSWSDHMHRDHRACPFCDNFFTTNGELEVHKIEVHDMRSSSSFHLLFDEHGEYKGSSEDSDADESESGDGSKKHFADGLSQSTAEHEADDPVEPVIPSEGNALASFVMGYIQNTFAKAGRMPQPLTKPLHPVDSVVLGRIEQATRMKKPCWEHLVVEGVSADVAHCYLCRKPFPSATEVIRHMENFPDCFMFPDEFFAYIRAQDPENAFTAPANAPRAFNPARKPMAVWFKCPTTRCTKNFDKLADLLDHFQATLCGAAVKSDAGDKLNLLKGLLGGYRVQPDLGNVTRPLASSEADPGLFLDGSNDCNAREQMA